MPENIHIIVEATYSSPKPTIPDSEFVVADCGHSCWASPLILQQYEEYRSHGLPVEWVCMICWGHAVRRGEVRGGEYRMAPGQLEHIREMFGPEAAYQAAMYIEQMNDYLQTTE